MRWLILPVVLLICATPANAADNAALWAKLKDGGSVALVRHGRTPGGFGDPPGFRLDDCATQRNLTDEGRAQSRALGARIRAQGIRIGKVLSSQWCRCRETAELMDLGPIEPAATFNNVVVLRDQREQLRAGARDVISAWKGRDVLVVVTHGANIFALTGIQPGEGGIVVVEPDANTKDRFRTLGQIAPGS
ncbi:MAG: histidine phosphatase family protein [Rhizobiales bacterium]|nr:histidine phosphatase family protein [Hyphomicrobiales bacterium]